MKKLGRAFLLGRFADFSFLTLKMSRDNWTQWKRNMLYLMAFDLTTRLKAIKPDEVYTDKEKEYYQEFIESFQSLSIGRDIYKRSEDINSIDTEFNSNSS